MKIIHSMLIQNIELLWSCTCGPGRGGSISGYAPCAVAPFLEPKSQMFHKFRLLLEPKCGFLSIYLTFFDFLLQFVMKRLPFFLQFVTKRPHFFSNLSPKDPHFFGNLSPKDPHFFVQFVTKRPFFCAICHQKTPIFRWHSSLEDPWSEVLDGTHTSLSYSSAPPPGLMGYNFFKW